MITSCPRLFMQSSWRLLWRSKLLYSRSPNRKPRCGGARKTSNRHIHDLLWSSILHLLPDVTQKRQHFNDKLHDLYDGMSTSLSQKWTDPLDDQHPQELQQRNFTVSCSVTSSTVAANNGFSATLSKNWTTTTTMNCNCTVNRATHQRCDLCIERLLRAELFDLKRYNSSPCGASLSTCSTWPTMPWLIWGTGTTSPGRGMLYLFRPLMLRPKVSTAQALSSR